MLPAQRAVACSEAWHLACARQSTSPARPRLLALSSQYLYTLTLPNKRAEMFLKIVPRGLVVMKGHGVPKSA